MNKPDKWKEEYNEYTIGLALVDLMPVVFFLMSGLIIYSMYESPVLLAGVLSCFAGGLCKAIWKLIIVVRKEDHPGLTRAFRILMPAGFAMMLLSVFTGGRAALTGLWRSLTMMPAAVFFAAGIVLMCVMGYLGSHMDSSARSNWIEELINTLAQLAVLSGIIVVYFGTYYHADNLALEALKGVNGVGVSEITQEEEGVNGWYFDGPGTDSALVFYPGAKVEAAAYAPLMEKLSMSGVDCYLCDMPLNFALLGKDAAGTIRSKETDNYEKWYIGGHSLGGVAASMAANDAEEAGSETAWNGIILLAAYPTEELSTPVLSIFGTEDKVLNTGKYEKTAADGLWPADFTEVVIEGGNHALFGNYGEQKGDGIPAITADMQQKEAADAIITWTGSK